MSLPITGMKRASLSENYSDRQPQGAEEKVQNLAARVMKLPLPSIQTPSKKSKLVPNRVELRSEVENLIFKLKVSLFLNLKESFREDLTNPLISAFLSDDWANLLFIAGKSTKDPLEDSLIVDLLNIAKSSSENNISSLLEGASSAMNEPLTVQICTDFNCSPRTMAAAFDRLTTQDSRIFLIKLYGKALFREIFSSDNEALKAKFARFAPKEFLFQIMVDLIKSGSDKLEPFRLFLQEKQISWEPSQREVIEIFHILNQYITFSNLTFALNYMQSLNTFRIDQNEANLLAQLVAVPKRGMHKEKVKFLHSLASWLMESKNYPSPFAWSQAVLKCVKEDDIQTLNLLWKMTKTPALPLSKLSPRWSHLMMDQYKLGNSSYIRALPLIFSYDFSTDSFGASDVSEEYCYNFDELDPLWEETIEATLTEESPMKRRNILSLLLTSTMTNHISLKTKLRVFTTLVEAEEGESAGELLVPTMISKLKTNDLQRLQVKLGSLGRDLFLTLSKTYQRISSALRQREAQEELESEIFYS